PDHTLSRRRREGPAARAAARRPRSLPRLRAPRRREAHGARRHPRRPRPAPPSRRPRPAHRRPRSPVGRRMRRLILVAAVVALGGCGSGSAPRGISVRVDSKPFLVTVLDNGKTVVSESKDGRLRYQLDSTGDVHTLTNVTSSNGSVYQVATDEPGRTA